MDSKKATTFKLRDYLGGFTVNWRNLPCILLTWVVTTTIATADDVSSSNVELPGFSWPAPGEIFIVAHRACWSSAPENSIAALERCRQLGVEAIEFDVQLTRDGVAVVFHDRTLDRMTQGSGNLSDLTYTELQSLNLKERDGVGSDIIGYPFLTRHRIPLLSDFLLAAKGDILLNLEIKANERWSFDETFAKAVEVVNVVGVEEQVFWKIPAPRRGGGIMDVSADSFFNLLPTTGLTMMSPIIWRSERTFMDQIADYAEHEISIFELVSDDATYWTLDSDGKIVGADETIYMGVSILSQWGGQLNDENALLDPETAWGGMIDLGFRMIMTDRPEQLVDYLMSNGLR